ncbi:MULTISPECIES: hypothetical protein [unclassified Rhizobium]|uniref:hypothetical protein n=1 Tax=unclassified Rhizobium TaxID=2613769 RepID=UPI000714EE8F|nr:MULTISPECIES: hypothetical protein [unclassified Rhizobium]KQS97778.1 hypothetical protein ASG50_21475 [Rhizobium sp. Leaf386]KQT00036.1 hypothetical protein ASG42_04070 [Rhizobium sp. Leaf391]KQT97041.1 hypothetical protein ASG68_08795 [Rhizobium sp. Leaf453]
MDDETRLNWDLIRTPLGIEWSGRTRYAAATFFYHRGEMSAEVLEVYRICSRIDAEDPVDVLERWQVGAEWVERIKAARA